MAAAVLVMVAGVANGPPDPGAPHVLPDSASDCTVSALEPPEAADWLPCSRSGC